MKGSRCTDEQIIDILKEHEAGAPVSELCGEHNVSDVSIPYGQAPLWKKLVMLCLAERRSIQA